MYKLLSHLFIVIRKIVYLFVTLLQSLLVEGVIEGGVE